MVQISPSLLEFRGPFVQSSTEYITLTNDSQDTIAFKVKTTAPKLYCVRPNAASVEPGETVEVSVIFLGLKSEPEEDYKCNDKFLIVTLPCPYPLGEQAVADVWSKLESEFKPQSVSKKIKVAFVQGANQEATDDEQTAVGGESVQTGSLSEKSSEKASAKELSEEKAVDELSQEDRSKIDALNEKLDSNTVESEASSATKQKTVTSQSPIPITTVILFALIAFIIGWLFF